MAKIIPFTAVRPTRDKANLLAARSYESYTAAQVESRLRDNPFSFLHIVNPGYRFNKDISGEERYGLVKNRYQEFKEDGIFMQDPKPSFYIYKIVNRDGLEFNGIVGAASVQDYKDDVIKKHEDTLEFRVSMLKKYIKTVGFNAEAVLLTYPDNPKLKSVIAKVMQNRPEYEFTTTYRDTHYLWNVDDEALLTEIQDVFKTIPALYIADGHHRSASSYLLAEDLKNQDPEYNGTEAYNYFMSYLIPESDLKIYEFNRLIKDLNGLEKEEFLIRLDEYYRIENRGTDYYKPSKVNHFSMYLDGEFYSLHLRKSKYKITNALDALDTHILYVTILKPLLGIEDLRNDQRIEYSHGKKDLAYVKTVVDSGAFAVGFGLLPVTTEEMRHIADQGLKMPPKSTYIEPKLRSGVTVYEF
ncbi:DUF1015 domain-containing protein [Aequorivita marina]|uniref:DUF1015 domain-containing protein n=1 Tax=Aequorivita marina TaxID=3073654 RepID=UPI002874CDD6|nr:DUF1015 domain-containing protein [Aequorivita sp. S2608]MDS1299788.1 DUF1015 domain-containing protein [Aequorivita sp. S2608]